jgi:hypothetical protein
MRSEFLHKNKQITLTSSYMALPAIFSAVTTGPETPKTDPNLLSRSSSRISGKNSSIDKQFSD